MSSSVTVIIPVLNGMPYLPEALASLAAQTLRDFEVVLWDNGSTDGTVEEARRWIPGRLPGRVVTGQPLPLHQCLARMVEEARTDLIARMDADDVCLPERFERQVAFLAGNRDVVAVGGQITYIDGRGCEVAGAPFYPVHFASVLAQLPFQCPMPHPAVLARKSAIVAAGNFRRPKPMEDYDLWFRLAQQGCLANLPGVVLRYRIHRASATHDAQRQGVHCLAMRECRIANVPVFFGVSEAAYVKMLDRRCVFAFPHVMRLARVISARTRRVVRDVFSLDDFLFTARCLTRRGDFISRVLYLWWGRNKERTFATQVVEKASYLPVVRGFIAQAARVASRRRMRQWVKAQQRSGCVIEGLDVRGPAGWVNRVALGRGVSIERDVTFAFQQDTTGSGRLRIGDGAFIGRNTFISAYDEVEIGDDALIGAYCYIASNNHKIETRAVPIKAQGYTLGPVRVGAGAWLGTHVCLMPGVSVGEGAVVGAGSVVTKDIPAYEVWAGVPARRLRERP